MQGKKKSISMIWQVTILFMIGVIIVSVLSSFALFFLAQDNVKTSFMSRGRAVAMGLDSYVSEYPAKEWLYRYWYTHYDTLD